MSIMLYLITGIAVIILALTFLAMTDWWEILILCATAIIIMYFLKSMM